MLRLSAVSWVAFVRVCEAQTTTTYDNSGTYFSLGNSGGSGSGNEFTLASDILVENIIINYFPSAGDGLNCNGDTHSVTSRWGCIDTDGTTTLMTLRITDALDNVVFPTSDTQSWDDATGILSGLQESDVAMTWTLNTPVTLTAGSYRLWEYNDLTDVTETDNSGFVQYSVQLITPALPTPPAAGSDPVAVSGDWRREFMLPVGEMTLMLKAPGLTITGKVFGTSNQEQWFDHFVVNGLHGEPVVDVRIRENIGTLGNRSTAPPRAFQTMDVVLGGGSRPLTVMPVGNPRQAQAVLGFFKMNEGWIPVQQTRIGSVHRECAEVNTVFVHFAICSASASEYFGWQRDLAVKYAHLDLLVHRIRDKTTMSGVLPELWGMARMTEATRKLVINEKKIVRRPPVSLAPTPTEFLEAQAANDTNDSSVEAWAGGECEVTAWLAPAGSEVV